MNDIKNTWMEEARGIAAECWRDPETEKKTMDPILAEAVAKRIAMWMDTAAQNQRNTDYYRGLVIRCGVAIGKDAYIQDDGGISDSVLCAKVPELVEKAEQRRDKGANSMNIDDFEWMLEKGYRPAGPIELYGEGQYIDGKWYVTRLGCDTLQHIKDEIEIDEPA